MDADGGVQVETAAALPGQHVFDDAGVEQLAALAEAEDAALEEAEDAAQEERLDVLGIVACERLEVPGVVACELGGLNQPHGVIRLLAEEAVRDYDVEVEVAVQAGAAAVQEGDSADAGVGGGAGAGAAEAGLDGPEPDAQDGAGQLGVMGQVGAQPSQRTRAKPWARMPQRMEARKSRDISIRR